MNRRQFLNLTGGGIGAAMVAQGFPGMVFAQKKRMSLATGPGITRKRGKVPTDP